MATLERALEQTASAFAVNEPRDAVLRRWVSSGVPSRVVSVIKANHARLNGADDEAIGGIYGRHAEQGDCR